MFEYNIVCGVQCLCVCVLFLICWIYVVIEFRCDVILMKQCLHCEL